MEPNNLEEQKTFVQLLKELTETQTTLAKINAQLAIREGKDQITAVINQTQKNLKNSAKRFGVNLKNMEEKYLNENANKQGVLQEYKNALSQINEQYTKLFQDAIEKKAQLEADEQSTMIEAKETKIQLRDAKHDFSKQYNSLKAEIVKATKEGNLELAQQKILQLQNLKNEHPINTLQQHNQELQTRKDELRQLITNCEEEFEKFKNERKEAIDKLTTEKNNKLATIPKQNIFQKVMGAMFNKFNGTKKFMKTAIEPLQAKVNNIKEEGLPQIKQMITEKRQEFSEKIYEARSKIEETVQGKVDEYKAKATQTKDDLVELRQNAIKKAVEMGKSAQEAKAQFIQNAKDKKDAFVQGVKDKAETAAIYGMEAKDFVKDKMETAAIYGMEAKDFVKDKIETAAIYGMEAKDTIVQGVKNTKKQATAKVKQAKNSVITHVTSAIATGKRTYKGIIGKGTEIKMNAISQIQAKLDEKQAELAEKMQTMAVNDNKDKGFEMGE